MSNTSHIGTAAAAQPTTNPPAARRGSESQSPQASPGGQDRAIPTRFDRADAEGLGRKSCRERGSRSGTACR